ncbi:MAG: DeoR/GlpR family DNA-binding transcription regulator, partial [Anaerolineae bacterium]|nr:DeoR/GlpR family DNA-binding transcription regulator [Anaerolineae bacterium]
MFLEERRQEILKFIVLQGRASVSELSERFNVSDVTIRADLQSLADSALIVRTYGGAIPPVNSIYELSLNRRRQQQQAEKQRIGLAASQLIQDGEAIFLDSSSTALTITPYINQHRDLTVLTNSPSSNDIESVAVVSRYTFFDLLEVNEEPAVKRTGGEIAIYEW